MHYHRYGYGDRKNGGFSDVDLGVGRNILEARAIRYRRGRRYPRPCRKMTGLPAERFLEEQYVLSEPLSPHRSAEIDGVEIDVEALDIPDVDGPLIIEGAGGLMVPLTRKNLLINQFKKWDIPVILVARTGLGTINHTLLSLEALWNRDIPVHGIVFVGEENEDNMKTISEFSQVKILGRLPMLDSLDANSLTTAFDNHFDLGRFLEGNFQDRF